MTTSNQSDDIVHVYAYWDSQEGVKPAWFAVARDAEDAARWDSQKIDWPCELGEYDEDQAEDVREALAAEWPDAEIEVVSQ